MSFDVENYAKTGCVDFSGFESEYADQFHISLESENYVDQLDVALKKTIKNGSQLLGKLKNDPTTSHGDFVDDSPIPEKYVCVSHV